MNWDKEASNCGMDLDMILVRNYENGIGAVDDWMSSLNEYLQVHNRYY